MTPDEVTWLESRLERLLIQGRPPTVAEKPRCYDAEAVRGLFQAQDVIGYQIGVVFPRVDDKARGLRFQLTDHG